LNIKRKEKPVLSCGKTTKEFYMKKKLLAAVLTALVLGAAAYAQSEEDFEVKQNKDNTLTITGYKGTAKELVIPGTLYRLRVTVIGEGAFSRKGLTSVVIPDTIVTIADAEYWPPDPINGAFSGNVLTKVTLGKGLKTIGDYAFNGNKQLAEIVIPDSVTRIGKRAFSYCGLTRITFGKGLKEIKEEAFAGNQIRVLTIPNGVVTIEGAIDFGTPTFGDNPLEAVSIPASLAKRNNFTGIRFDIFGHVDIFGNEVRMSITCITLPAGMEDNILKDNFESAFVNFWISQGRAAGTYIKRGPIWTKATAAEAAAYLKEIEAKAEQARQAAVQAVQEAEAKTEQARKDADAKQAAAAQTQAAFAQALEKTGLAAKERSDGTLEITGYNGKDKDLKIPADIGGKAVTRIGENAFRQRVAAGDITSVTVPDTVTEIGRAAFANLTEDGKAGKSKLAAVTWGKGLKRVEERAFAGNTAITTITSGTGNSETRIARDAVSDDFMTAWNNFGGKPKKYTKMPLVGWL
jgi:hypothetical protein